MNGRFEYVVYRWPYVGYEHGWGGDSGRSEGAGCCVIKREVTILNAVVKELTCPARQLIPNAV